MKLEFSIEILQLAEMPLMTRAIEFNREFPFFAKEIDKGVPDRILPAEL